MDNTTRDDATLSNEDLALQLIEIAEQEAYTQYEHPSDVVSRGYVLDDGLAGTDFLLLELVTLADELGLGNNPLFRNDNPPNLAEANLGMSVNPQEVTDRLGLSGDETLKVLRNIWADMSLPTIRKATYFAVLMAYVYRERFEQLTIQEREAYAIERNDNTPYCPDIKVEEAAARCLTAIMNGIYQARIHYAFCSNNLEHMKYFNFDAIVEMWLEGQRRQVLRVQDGYLPADLPTGQDCLTTALFQKAHINNADVEIVMHTTNNREILRRLTSLTLEEPGPDHEDNWRIARGLPPCERDMVHADPRAVRLHSYFGDLDPRMPMGLGFINHRRYDVQEWFPISRSFDIPRRMDDPARKEGLGEWQALELGTPGACIVERKEGHGF